MGSGGVMRIRQSLACSIRRVCFRSPNRHLAQDDIAGIPIAQVHSLNDYQAIPYCPSLPIHISPL